MKCIRSGNFSIFSSLSKHTPLVDGVCFELIKNTVVGKEYDLSLVFVGKKKMRQLNRTYRQKDYATDILSFSIDSSGGEIFIQPDVSRKKAKDFERSFSNYISFLFIHGLFHLKGFDHGSTMERKEEEIRKKFNI